jgi:hypothetical protein
VWACQSKFAIAGSYSNNFSAILFLKSKKPLRN